MRSDIDITDDAQYGPELVRRLQARHQAEIVQLLRSLSYPPRIGPCAPLESVKIGGEQRMDESWVGPVLRMMPYMFWGVVIGFGLFILGAIGMIIAIVLS